MALDCTILLMISRCQATPENFDRAGTPRFREHTRKLVETFDPGTLWDAFGVIGDVIVSQTIIEYYLAVHR